MGQTHYFIFHFHAYKPLCLFLSSTTFLYIPCPRKYRGFPYIPPPQPGNMETSYVPQPGNGETILCGSSSWGLFEKNWNNFLVTFAEKKKKEKKFTVKFKATTDNLTNLLEWKKKSKKPRRCLTFLCEFSDLAKIAALFWTLLCHQSVFLRIWPCARH